MNRRNRVRTAVAVIILAGFVSTGFAAQIGVILCSDTPYYKSIHKTFASELSANGIKADIIVQTPAPETGAWMNAARKFTAIGTDLIVTYGSPVTQAVLDENSAIPVVFAGVYDSQGLSVKGRKITGINSKVSLAGLLKNLKAVKDISTLGVLYNSAEKETVGEANEVERLGGQLSFKTVKVNVRSRDSIARIRDVDALLVTTSCAAMLYIDDIVSVARKQNIPTAALMAGGEDRGIILTLAADCTEQGKEAADRVASILRGENPSAMAVANPRKIQMTINLKEATSLGLKIPFDLLSAATRVIK
jgi:putative ABC transport system substrate-binding protein